ncbi:MAG: cobyric acid synthase [Planctomycetes bacterium]|nr:cobyric acid synthase [Planctomycetota bacterium]
MSYRHGGNLRELAARIGLGESDICDFSANINPLGPPDWLRSAVSRAVDSVVNYPDPDCRALVKAIADDYGIAAGQILVANRSAEIIGAIPRALGLKHAVIPVPAYSDYCAACELSDMTVEKPDMGVSGDLNLDLDALANRICGRQLVFIANPNNPTGLPLETDKLRALAKKHGSTVFVVDEAFMDFLADGESLIGNRPANVIVLRSMTKFYAIAGIRLGFAVGDEEIIGQIRKYMTPWSVNAIAQQVGVRAIKDKQYAARTIAAVTNNRQWLYEELSGVRGLYVYPGRANFLLVKITGLEMSARVLAERLLEKDAIAIRVCDNFDGLGDSYFRVAVKTRDDNSRLVGAIKRELNQPVKLPSVKKKPAIMFQGCSSSAGKSFLATALCRVLLQDGVRVAPFKSQNMSLNSFVTRDGGEMGRAQVVQAQACKLDPDVRMNPVLLKPNSDTGSQIIVLGRPVGNMKVSEYTDYKSGLFETVRLAYDSLCSENDVIVLEGAGSPAEINLKADDIVNMKMARYARSPVLLAGDIDRGGVFASFIGTMATMQPWERELTAGFIINRFRGDASLLGPAIDYTLDFTSKPVLGVVPYITQVSIPEEDSVQFKAGGFKNSPSQADGVDIVVIDPGHISNFTDFDPFTIEPDVTVRVARTVGEIGSPDALIVPGSKNVIADLSRLKESGMAEAIKKAAADGKTQVIGICAGFQMLGRAIKDPHHVESGRGQIDGIGLLDVTTVLAREKTLQLADATHLGSGLAVRGYEIHHGLTEHGNCEAVIRRSDEAIIGAGSSGGGIWGTYLHGIFDDDKFRRWFIDRLREGKGLEPLGKVCGVYDLEIAFDHLADVFRETVNMNRIYELLGL